jgi:hypothetical protein
MNPKKYLLIPALLFLFGCDPQIDEPPSQTSAPDNFGYRPVYGPQEFTTVEWTSPQAITSPGKIYTYGKYLLVNELKEGIHVYDNTNPQFPIALGFLRILGNTDMAIKDNVLYADHMGNLVSLTFTNFADVQEKGRLSLANWNLGIPPPRGYYFECVDASKGLVVSWQKTEKQNLNCYATR